MFWVALAAFIIFFLALYVLSEFVAPKPIQLNGAHVLVRPVLLLWLFIFHNYVIECFVWSTLYPCGICVHMCESWWRWDEKRGRQNVQIFVPTEPWALPQKRGGEMQNERYGTFTKQNVYGILSGLHTYLVIVNIQCAEFIAYCVSMFK